MRHARRARRATVVLTSALAVATAVAVPALAAASARATASTDVSVLSYGAQARPETGAAVNGAYVFTMPMGNSVHDFRVYNTGTVALSAQTYTAVATLGLLDIIAKPTVEVLACFNGVWGGSNNSGRCSGTTVPLATSSLGPQAASLSIPVGGWVQARARYISGFNLGASVTLNITVARSQARAASTTAS